MADEETKSVEADRKSDRGEALDKVALQRRWEKRIADERKANIEYRQDVEKSLKLLSLDKDARAKKGGDRLNIGWSNFEVLRSTVYARPPKPVVQPKYGGGPNRQALIQVSEVVERAIETAIEDGDMHGAMKQVRDDLLKTARGVPWVRYEAQFAEQENPLTMKVESVKAGERVAFDVVSWRNFLHGPAARWSGVPWVARCEHLERVDFRERFNLTDEDVTRLRVAQTQSKADGAPRVTMDDPFNVWEIWDKRERHVVFMVEGADAVLEVEEPLINVRGFFPCPEPAMSTFIDGTLRPIPEALFVADQLSGIDRTTARISTLENALKVRGFYAKGATNSSAAAQIEDAVRRNDDREILIGVPAWAANGKGDMGIEWLPIDVVASVIQELRKARQETIELVYQITGVSDVMRGASEAEETLGAQQIKSKWGNVRVRDRQEELRRVARDLCRMTAEIICEVFDGRTIAEMAVYGFDEQMMQLMRDDRARSMAIDVETDSTTQEDEQEDKQRRAELTEVIGGLIERAMPILQVMPDLIDFFGELIKFNIIGFRAGRSLEKSVDAMIETIKKGIAAKQAAPPQPDPKLAAAEMKAKVDMRGQDIDAQLRTREQDMKFAEAMKPEPPKIVASRGGQ